MVYEISRQHRGKWDYLHSSVCTPVQFNDASANYGSRQQNVCHGVGADFIVPVYMIDLDVCHVTASPPIACERVSKAS